MKPIVIAFVGPAGSGKSTAANHLIEKYGAKRYSFAAPLKEVAKRTLDFTDEQLYGTQAQKEAIDPRYGFSCRKFLQRLGTEGCRGVFGNDFWTKMTLSMIERDDPRIAVIDDARFENECECVRFAPMLSGYVVRLRPPADDETDARAANAGTHASEQEWLTAVVDEEIRPARRSIETLTALVDEVMKRVIK